MKLFLFILLVLHAPFIFSQDISITVTARSESVTASPENDNSSKLLLIKPSVNTTGNDYLTAKVLHEESDARWKRNFIIYDEDDNEIARLKSMKKNSYCVAMKDLLPRLQDNKNYALYTILLPEDPQQAMEVKVARQLICKIKIEK